MYKKNNKSITDSEKAIDLVGVIVVRNTHLIEVIKNVLNKIAGRVNRISGDHDRRGEDRVNLILLHTMGTGATK